MIDDKRLIPEFSRSHWCSRVSEREWHFCKYCAKDTPSFLLSEGMIGVSDALQTTRCCWECGSGIGLIG